MTRTIEIPENEHEFPELGKAVYMFVKSRFRSELWLYFPAYQHMTKIAGGERAEKKFCEMEKERKYIPFRVKKLAAKACGVTTDEMDTKERKTEVSFSRFLYWWYLTFKLGYSFTRAAVKNGRQHVSVARGARIVDELDDKHLKPEQAMYRSKFFELLKKENL